MEGMVVKPFTNEEMAAVFGRACDIYDSVIPSFAAFGRRLVELAGLDPGQEVLDVGAGRGASLFPATEAVGLDGRVTGIDLSTEMVRALTADVAALGHPGVTVRRMDAEALAFADGSFDAVLCGCAFQLLPRPALAASGFFRVLRPGGRVAVSAPADTSEAWGFFVPLLARYAKRAEGPVPPLTGAPRHDYPAIFRHAGFEDVKVVSEVANFLLPDEDAWWRWVWSNGLRAFLEPLREDALAELKAEAFEHLRPLVRSDGLHLDQRVRFFLGRRPLETPQ